MDIRIIITNDGQITVFTDSGTFEQGKEISEKLFRELEAVGLEGLDVKPPEQHRHAHEHDHAHAHNHHHE